MSKPTICGFTMVRNAIKFDYPIVESIKSILPIVDEYLVAVGNSDDGTLELIKNIGSPKIKIIETVWDDSLRLGGQVLAVETNKSFDAIGDHFDWCFYLQGDEVVHEKYHQTILDACAKYKDRKEVEGLLFDYTHFYGSFDYVGDSRTWYRKEIRIIKNDKSIRSYKDAQGFRKGGRKLQVKPIPAQIYHYGWVRDPRFQQAKQESFNKLWHSDDYVQQNVANANEYDYKTIDSLKRFEGTHPAIMKERLGHMNWAFTWDINQKKFSFKEGFLYWFEKLTTKRLFEYKNYKVI
jgi:glycosyltransferase involved in cell wall biosynthesis